MDTEKFAIRIDLQAFDIDIVKSVSYRFASKFAIDVSVSDAEIVCLFSASKSSSVDWFEVEKRFRRELLDQDLRRKIRNETEGYRNLILGLAYSRTGLQSDE